MTPRASVLVVCVLAGCFGEPPPSGGNATDDASSTASSSVAGTIDSATSMSTTIDPSDTAVMTTEPPTSVTSGDATTVDPASSGDSGVVADPFCDSIAAKLGTLLACQDFDESEGVIGQWDYDSELGAVVGVLADASAPSPPNVLHASFPARAGRAPFAEVRTELAKLTAPFHLRVRMELGACDGPTPLVSVQYFGVEPFYVTLVHTGSTLAVDIRDPEGFVTTYPLDSEVLGNASPWAEYGFDIDVVDGYVDVVVDGEFAAQLTGLAMPLAPFAPSLHFGVLGGGVDYACDVWFDDIVAY